MGAKTVWISGASGLVGGHALDALLEDDRWAAVVSFGRRPLPREHSKLTQREVDFSSLDATGAPRPDAALCCLGTTIKKAGSQEAFRAVDHHAVVAFARAAKDAGSEVFAVVTAHGADAGSMVFYNRVKGEVEADLRALGFASLAILRPSLLLGDRAESRPAERVMISLSRAAAPLLKPFAARPVEARAVGRALVRVAAEPPPGARVYPNDEIIRLGE